MDRPPVDQWTLPILDAEDERPLYRQIADAIVARVRAGDLPTGARLPPTRELARALGAHRNTVVKAFDALAKGGWTSSTVGRGTFIADDPPGITAQGTRAAGGLHWPALVSRASESEPLRRARRLAQTPAVGDVVNLTRMEPSRDLLPEAELHRCIDHVFRTVGADALSYAPRQGLERLRVLVAEDLHRVGLTVDPADVLITTGSQQAIDLIGRALVNAGDTFLTEGQTYSGALNALATTGARLVGVPCDDEGPELAALEALARPRAKGLYVIPSCRNPTGTTMSAARRGALVAWSRATSVPLVEDDYGADLNLDDTPSPPPLRALDPDVFYLGTFSKKLAPALRVGFVVGPAAMTSTLSSVKHAMDLGTSALLQHALAEFLARGYLPAHLARTLPEYARRRDALVAGLSEALPAEVSWEHPRRGVVLWLNLPPDLDAEEVFEEARRAGVLVSPSTIYTASGPARAGLRLVFCAEPPDRLREGARRLGLAIGTIARRRRAARTSARPSLTVDIV